MKIPAEHVEQLRKAQKRVADVAREDIAALPCLLAGEEGPLRAVIEGGEADGDFRARRICGQVESADRLVMVPANVQVAASALACEGERCLVRGVDIGAGECRARECVLCDAQRPAQWADTFSVLVAWLDDAPLYGGRTYAVLTGSGKMVEATVARIKGRIDGCDGVPLAARKIDKGELAHVELALDQFIVFDDAGTGTPFSWLVFTDARQERVLGIGLIEFALRRATNIHWQQLPVSKALRAEKLGQKPFVLWFTGLSASGKSTVAGLLEKRLLDMGKHCYLLDGDNVRHGLCRDLGFTAADRIENMRRITEVARLMVDAGLITIVSFISPLRQERERARRRFEPGEFIEVFVDTPLHICEQRDPKGLYAKARAGELVNFTGIDSPYEPPENPDVHLDGARMTPEEMVEQVVEHLLRQRLL